MIKRWVDESENIKNIGELRRKIWKSVDLSNVWQYFFKSFSKFFYILKRLVQINLQAFTYIFCKSILIYKKWIDF